ncbi:RNA polymerase sigma factor [Anatilimnocola floriformis]|uniref:RNA polymerase sigma factor n=1 Tax=Anatilimnocola floriformis TaxID=2948575 RepID=UPI0020C3FA04|nr:RNA polymerase sigma factor [Anatilimnocola floriformis]
MNSIETIRQAVDDVYRVESRRVFATLVRLLGDFDLAEDVLHEAFAAALQQWQQTGVPENPRAWLVSTGKFKAVDVIRRRSKFDSMKEEVARPDHDAEPQPGNEQDIEDDRLRLIFTCCHPALAGNVQVALTLREVCGLTTEEIARAFLTNPATMAQRIVRGKAKIRDAKIPYEVPGAADLPDRIDSVLQVTYLVFNEGYAASSGETVTRHDLSEEAIRLGWVLVELMPVPEVMGLLALMLLQESRRSARATADGEIILLEQQDRQLWNRDQIRQGKELLTRSLGTRRFGPYTVQAAIAAAHADAPTAAETDWGQIVALYDVLQQLTPSPIVALNRAVAVTMRDGPAAGLALVDEILAEPELAEYHLAHAARADIYRRLGKTAEAINSYQRALELARQEPERRFLEKRLRELAHAAG